MWEVKGVQLVSNQQLEGVNSIGIFIEPANTMSKFSTIYISQKARTIWSIITIRCIARKGIATVDGVPHSVITICKYLVCIISVCGLQFVFQWTENMRLDVCVRAMGV